MGFLDWVSHRVSLNLKCEIHCIAYLVKSLTLLHEGSKVALLELARHVLLNVNDFLLLLIKVLDGLLLPLTKVLILFQFALNLVQLLVEHLFRGLGLLKLISQPGNLFKSFLVNIIVLGLELN